MKEKDGKLGQPDRSALLRSAGRRFQFHLLDLLVLMLACAVLVPLVDPPGALGRFRLFLVCYVMGLTAYFILRGQHLLRYALALGRRARQIRRKREQLRQSIAQQKAELDRRRASGAGSTGPGESPPTH